MRKYLFSSFLTVFLMALGVSFAQNQVIQAPQMNDDPLSQAPASGPVQSPGQAPNQVPFSVPAGPPLPDIPLIQNAEGYNYDPTGRRDPFKPFGQSQSTQAPGLPTEPAIPPEPLQLFEVTQLKLVGIIWEVKSPKAMIKDPLGKLHMVRKETKIGRNNGFVAAIREGEVVVVEPTIGENGMPSAITRVLNLTR